MKKWLGLGGLLALLMLSLVGCIRLPEVGTSPAPSPPVQTFPATPIGVSPTVPMRPTVTVPATTLPTPCVSVARANPQATARLGSSLLSFVQRYGEPVSCAMNDLRFPVGSDGGYTLDLPDSDPVRLLTVTADAGNIWDALTQQRVCQGYMPPNPVFIGSSGNIYTYQTDEGMVEYINGPDTCTLEFTGM